MAPYIAMSARRSSSSAVLPSSGKKRDADARADECFTAVDHERFLQTLDHLDRHGLGLERALNLRQHDRILVPAESGHGIRVAQYGRKSQPGLLQQLIAAAVTERVVDFLEAVEVDEQHGEAPLVAMRLRHGLAQPIVEQLAIRQTRERVEVGALKQFRLAVAGRDGDSHADGELANGLRLARRELDAGRIDRDQRTDNGVADSQRRDACARRSRPLLRTRRRGS